MCSPTIHRLHIKLDEYMKSFLLEKVRSVNYGAYRGPLIAGSCLRSLSLDSLCTIFQR